MFRIGFWNLECMYVAQQAWRHYFLSFLPKFHDETTTNEAVAVVSSMRVLSPKEREVGSESFLAVP